MQISSSQGESALQLAISAGRAFYHASEQINAVINDKVAVVVSEVSLARDVVRGLGLEPKV
eukprot:4896031-Pyramimonas_sp.AAC.1